MLSLLLYRFLFPFRFLFRFRFLFLFLFPFLFRIPVSHFSRRPYPHGLSGCIVTQSSFQRRESTKSSSINITYIPSCNNTFLCTTVPLKCFTYVLFIYLQRLDPERGCERGKRSLPYPANILSVAFSKWQAYRWMNATFLRDVSLISGLGFATCGHFIKGNDISSPLVTTGSLMVSGSEPSGFHFSRKDGVINAPFPPNRRGDSKKLQEVFRAWFGQ